MSITRPRDTCSRRQAKKNMVKVKEYRYTVLNGRMSPGYGKTGRMAGTGQGSRFSPFPVDILPSRTVLNQEEQSSRKIDPIGHLAALAPEDVQGLKNTNFTQPMTHN